MAQESAEPPAVQEAQPIEEVAPPGEMEEGEAASEGTIELEFDDDERFNIFDADQIQLIDLEDISERFRQQIAAAEIKLSLQECVHLALMQNQDLLIIHYQPQKAWGDILAARGQFNPAIGGSFQWTDARQSANPQTVAFGGVTSVENYSTTAQLQLSGVLPWGTQYGVTASIEREEGTFSQFVAEYGSRLTLNLTQPLLRGFGHGANLANIRVANNALTISQTQVMAQVMDTIGQVVNAYWDLVGAREILRVQESALDNAERIVDINEKRLELGMAAEIEVLQAKAGVAPRITDVVNAVKAIADAEDNLKLLLNMRDGDYLSRVRILPTDAPSEFEFSWNEEESFKLALEYRPEIQAQELQIDNATIRRREARTELLPQLDVSTNITFGGRNSNLEETFNGLRRKQDEIMTFGITGSIPIGNQTARGNYHRAKLELEEQEVVLEQVKSNLMSNVRFAGRDVVVNKVIIDSSKLDVQLQEINVRAEEERLRIGSSTPQQVLEIQENLTAAEVNLETAYVNAEKALANLRLAEGTLLQEFGVDYELPEIEKALNSFDSFQDRSNTWRQRKYGINQDRE